MAFKVWVGLALASAAATGCSLVVDTDRVQCTRDADCEDLGFADMECQESLCVTPEVVETPFSCRTTPFVPQQAATNDFSMSVFNLIGQTPYEGLTIKACPQFDTACETPIGQTDSDATGRFTLALPIGFRGHLFAPPPAADPDLMPRYINIFPPPGPTVLSASEEFFVASLPVVTGIAQLAGGQIITGTGHVFVTATDCNGNRLNGVTISVATVLAETFDLYIGDSGQPDPALLATGNLGQGAIVNVPPGFVTVRAVHQTEGKIFEQSALVSADTITSISTVVPSPVQ